MISHLPSPFSIAQSYMNHWNNFFDQSMNQATKFGPLARLRLSLKKYLDDEEQKIIFKLGMACILNSAAIQASFLNPYLPSRTIRVISGVIAGTLIGIPFGYQLISHIWSCYREMQRSTKVSFIVSVLCFSLAPAVPRRLVDESLSQNQLSENIYASQLLWMESAALVAIVIFGIAGFRQDTFVPRIISSITAQNPYLKIKRERLIEVSQFVINFFSSSSYLTQVFCEEFKKYKHRLTLPSNSVKHNSLTADIKDPIKQWSAYWDDIFKLKAGIREIVHLIKLSPKLRTAVYEHLRKYDVKRPEYLESILKDSGEFYYTVQLEEIDEDS